MRTDGISPKVLTPTILTLIVGVVLLLTGDTDTGKTLILAAVGVGATGYAANPGDVAPAVDDFDPAAGDVRPPA